MSGVCHGICRLRGRAGRRGIVAMVRVRLDIAVRNEPFGFVLERLGVRPRMVAKLPFRLGIVELVVPVKIVDREIGHHRFFAGFFGFLLHLCGQFVSHFDWYVEDRVRHKD